MMRLNFKTHNQCVDYLIDNFYEESFLENHTRKELAYILTIIESHALKQSPYAFRSMCKKRACQHIEFYLKVHMKNRLYIKNLLTERFGETWRSRISWLN